jgi:GT2 family glycosyltransferase
MTGISVIIPTLNRTDFLIQTLDCLVKQVFEHPFEILIVDQSDREDKQIMDYQEQYTFVKYCHITSFRGLPEARNFGWQHAQYDYVLYVDDDITCENSLLTEHYRYITKPETGIVAGGITEKYNKNTDTKTGYFSYWKVIPFRAFHVHKTGYVDHAGGGNFSAKKSVLEKVGGLDEHFTKGAALYEETDLCLRVKKAGYNIFFNYDAHIYHLAAPTGGCRVIDIEKYVFNLSRNRSIIIVRHLRWYHKPTAYLYLLKLISAYSFSYKKIELIKTGIKGINEGRKVGKQQPLYYPKL